MHPEPFETGVAVFRASSLHNLAVFCRIFAGFISGGFLDFCRISARLFLARIRQISRKFAGKRVGASGGGGGGGGGGAKSPEKNLADFFLAEMCVFWQNFARNGRNRMKIQFSGRFAPENCEKSGGNLEIWQKNRQIFFWPKCGLYFFCHFS